MQEEGVEGFPQGFQIGGAYPEHYLLPLIGVARHQRDHGGKMLLLGDGGNTEGRLELGG